MGKEDRDEEIFEDGGCWRQPFQQACGGLWEALYETLTDFEFLEAKCTYSGTIQAPGGENGRKLYSGVYELIEDYQRALAVFPADK